VDTLISLVSDAIIFVIIALFFIGVWVTSRLEQRLPEKQRQALIDFTNIAVRYIEQRFADLSSEQKKDAAVRFVIKLFVEYRLPVPDQAVIEAAIESVVWGIHNVGENTRIKQQRDRSISSTWTDGFKRNKPSNRIDDLRE